MRTENNMKASERSLKKFAPEQLELAIGKALRELTGDEYSVSIAQIDFSSEGGLTGPGQVPMHVNVRRVVPNDDALAL